MVSIQRGIHQHKMRELRQQRDALRRRNHEHNEERQLTRDIRDLKTQRFREGFYKLTDKWPHEHSKTRTWNRASHNKHSDSWFAGSTLGTQHYGSLKRPGDPFYSGPAKPRQHQLTRTSGKTKTVIIRL